ncbi:MAG TPA: ABC transporter permease [Firmicutes bacterium]|nr:ABC transporter permease [Bacillota bacterium]
MSAYLIRKLALTLVVLLGTATCAFILVHLVPGDPAHALAGPQATPEDVENLRRSLQLDRPLIVQYAVYMRNLLRLDLGRSYTSNKPVIEEIAARWPATLQLSLASLVVAVAVGVPAGVVAATRRGSLADTITMMGAFLGVSMPSFWLGLLLILLFSVKLKLLPFLGRSGPASFVLPSLTLGLGVAANIARLTRASMLEVLGQDYVRTARGKGVPGRRVVYVHALRNASIPIVTIVGLQLGALLGGQVVTEKVFSWPGIGRMIVDALMTRDLLLVQGGILVLSLTFAITNLLTDICYAILDPRIRF